MNTGKPGMMSDSSKTPVVETTAENREEFLATFSSQEEKHIRRKVDKRFLLLIGLMYMVKQVCLILLSPDLIQNTKSQIDVNNVSSIKVLQVGEKSNILNELNMSSDQYNWVSSIYTVCLLLHTREWF